MVLSGLDDPALGQTTGYNPKVGQAIAHLPLVEHADTQIGFDGNINLDGSPASISTRSRARRRRR